MSSALPRTWPQLCQFGHNVTCRNAGEFSTHFRNQHAILGHDFMAVVNSLATPSATTSKPTIIASSTNAMVRAGVLSQAWSSIDPQLIANGSHLTIEMAIQCLDDTFGAGAVDKASFTVQLAALILSNLGSDKVDNCGTVVLVNSNTGSRATITWTDFFNRTKEWMDKVGLINSTRQWQRAFSDLMWDAYQAKHTPVGQHLAKIRSQLQNRIRLSTNREDLPNYVFVPDLWPDKLTPEEQSARQLASLYVNLDDDSAALRFESLHLDQDNTKFERSARRAETANRIRQSGRV